MKSATTWLVSGILLSAPAAARGQDTIPPDPITTLTAAPAGQESATLSWINTGDDGDTGTADWIEFYASTQGPLNDDNYPSDTAYLGGTDPLAAGTPQSFTVTGLQGGQLIWIAAWIYDENGLYSAFPLENNATVTPLADTIPPAAVTGLAVESDEAPNVGLSWIATGDDGTDGWATRYQIGYRTTGPITTDLEFNATSPANWYPPVGAQGIRLTYTVPALAPGTLYHFCIRAFDNVGNPSPLSGNMPATPHADTVPPAAIGNLAVSTTAPYSITLTWTAPGDDGGSGTATSYDLRYSEGSIADDTAFGQATQVEDEPAPTLAGTTQTFTIKGLSMETSYAFAIRTADEGGRWSPLSNPVETSTMAPGNYPDSWTGPLFPAPTLREGGGIVATDDPDLLFVDAGGFETNVRFSPIQHPCHWYRLSTEQWTSASIPYGRVPYAALTRAPGLGFFALSSHYYHQDTGSIAGVLWHCDSSGTWVNLAGYPASTPRDLSIAATPDAVYAISSAREFMKFRLDGSEWIALPLPSPMPLGGMTLTYPGSGDFIYAIGRTTNTIARYSISGDEWLSSTLHSFPVDGGCVTTPGPSNSILCLSSSTADAGGPMKARLHRFDTASQQWTELAASPVPTVPALLRPGAGIAWAGSDTVWCLRGGGTDFWNYSLSSDRFASQPAPAPEVMTEDCDIVGLGNGNDLYAIRGGSLAGFYHYSIATDRWEEKAPFPAPIGQGALGYAGGDFIYALDGLSQTFRRYSIRSDQWSDDSAELDAFPTAADYSTRILSGGDGALFAWKGNAIYRYSIADNHWDLTTYLPPGGLFHGAAAARVGDSICVLQGGGGALWVYSISRHAWDVPVTAGAPYLAYAMCADPSGRRLCLIGRNSGNPAGEYALKFLSFSINENVWSQMAPPPGEPAFGTALVCPGPGYFLYALQGPGSRSLWRYQTSNHAPTAPVAVDQFHSNGTTPLPPAPLPGSVMIDSSFVARARGGDPDGELIRFEVQVKPVGVPFDDDAPADGTSGLVGGDSAAIVTLRGLAADVSWRWRVRTVDSRGLFSPWIGFGANGDDQADFRTRSNSAPAARMLVQSAASTGIELGVGGQLVDETAVIFRAVVEDADGDDVEFQVEVVRAGQAFRGEPTMSGAMQGLTGSASLDFAEGRYQWRCRGVDAFGIPGAWRNFGDNPESEADFEILSRGSRGASACLSSSGFPSGGRATAFILLGLALAFRRRPAIE